jgi:hypothetical protein
MPLPILLLQRLLMRVGSARRHSLHPDRVLRMPPTPPPPAGNIIPGLGVLWEPACGCTWALPCGDGSPVAESTTEHLSLRLLSCQEVDRPKLNANTGSSNDNSRRLRHEEPIILSQIGFCSWERDRVSTRIIE